MADYEWLTLKSNDYTKDNKDNLLDWTDFSNIGNEYKTVGGKKVWDPFNKVNLDEVRDEIDNEYEDKKMKNDLKYFELQKKDYERSVARENQAQANLDASAKFVFGGGNKMKGVNKINGLL